MNQSSLGALAFFEGTRMLIPGALGVFLAGMSVWATGAAVPTDVSTVAALTLSAGLVLYLADLPEFAPEYYHLGPLKWIASQGQGHMRDGSSPHIARRIDYVFLDDLLPAGVRLRSQYYRMMFRVGLELPLLVTLGISAAAIASDWTMQPSIMMRLDWRSASVVLAFLGVGLTSVWVTSSNAGRRAGKKTWRMIAIGLKGRRFLLVGAIGSVVLALLGQALASAGLRVALVKLGCTSAAGVWWWTVLVGQESPRSQSRRYIPTNEKVLILFPILLGPVVVLGNVASGSGQLAPLAAWCALAIVPLLTESRRRYMDRYEGASGQQVTWMKMCQPVIHRILLDGAIESRDIREMRSCLGIGPPDQ